MQQNTITLEKLGWDAQWESSFAGFRSQGFEPARVAVEDKHHYEVMTPRGMLLAQVTGRLLHASRTVAQLPKVGDWVACSFHPDKGRAVLQGILPRRNKLSRKVPGRQAVEQVLVANVDVAFIVQSLDRPSNPRLLERFLIMVSESGARSVIVLNKADLSANLEVCLAEVSKVSGSAPVIPVSAKTGQAMPALLELIRPGETVVFLGPSGVGKSSLINRLYGDELQATTEVREGDARGRHTTTWRELILLPNGGLVIDTPGLREFHLWAALDGLSEIFSDIEDLTVQCRFRACTHTAEKHCAVLAAVAAGSLAQDRYDNYQKLRRDLGFVGGKPQWWASSKSRRPYQVGGRQPRRPNY